MTYYFPIIDFICIFKTKLYKLILQKIYIYENNPTLPPKMENLEQ